MLIVAIKMRKQTAAAPLGYEVYRIEPFVCNIH
mgnify:FL=1